MEPTINNEFAPLSWKHKSQGDDNAWQRLSSQIVEQQRYKILKNGTAAQTICQTRHHQFLSHRVIYNNQFQYSMRELDT